MAVTDKEFIRQMVARDLTHGQHDEPAYHVFNAAAPTGEPSAYLSNTHETRAVFAHHGDIANQPGEESHLTATATSTWDFIRAMWW